MTVTVKKLISKQIENSQTTQYTADGVRTIVDKFTVVNTSGTTATISVNYVTLGGSAGDSNLIVKNKSILAGETYSSPDLVGHTLEAGGFISTIASASSSLTVYASGREIT